MLHFFQNNRIWHPINFINTRPIQPLGTHDDSILAFAHVVIPTIIFVKTLAELHKIANVEFCRCFFRVVHKINNRQRPENRKIFFKIFSSRFFYLYRSAIIVLVVKPSVNSLLGSNLLDSPVITSIVSILINISSTTLKSSG